MTDSWAYAELLRLATQAEKMRWDKEATKSRRDFDEGRAFAYGQAMALLRGESVT
jgi:hypothetical protein